MTNKNMDPTGGVGILVQIVKRFRLVWLLFTDSRVPVWSKLILPLSWVYLIFPFDFIPDMMPVIGQMDDLGVLLLAMALFVKICPEDIVLDYMNELDYGDNHNDDIIDANYRVMNDQE